MQCLLHGHFVSHRLFEFCNDQCTKQQADPNGVVARPAALHRSRIQGSTDIQILARSTPCRRVRPRRVTALQQGTRAAHDPAKVVGLGLACWDYLAQVAAFPQPDEKIRTLQLQTRGGGNAGNALTAASRLGADCYLVTKLGDDAVGDQIANELKSDGINLSYVLRAADSVSDFSYIIADKAGGTRTCIQTHSDQSEYTVQDLQSDRVEQILADATLVYFDGRLTEAAIQLAKAARRRGIPILVEAERLRPGLDELLQEADYLCTSEKFPKLWTQEANLGDAMLTCLQRLPHLRWMITTLGKRGSALVQRSEVASSAGSLTLDEQLADMLQQVVDSQHHADTFQGCTHDSLQLRSGNVVSTEQPLRVKYTRQHTESSSESGQQPMNKASDSHRAVRPHHSTSSNSTRTAIKAKHNTTSHTTATVMVASAAQLPQGAVQDTTGAGDAFIGTVLYAITHGLSLEKMLKLAALVAASSCTGLGSRPALPHAHQISQELLIP